MSSLVPGMLWTYFQNAILVTIPVSLILLVWYRRAVTRGMRARGDIEREPEESGFEDTTEAQPASTTKPPADPIPRGNTNASRTRLQLRLAVIYSVAGAVASAILTAFFFRMDVEFTALRAFAVWYALCWPIVPIVATLLVFSRRRGLAAFLVYAVTGAVLIWAWSAFNKIAFATTGIAPWSNAIGFIQYLGYEAWLPYLIILVTGNRRLRSVSPLALAGLLVFSYSALGLNYAVVALMDVGAARQWLLGLAGANFQRVLFLLAALPVGLACWRALRLLGRGFENKSFSDVQLLVDSWWLIVVFAVAITFSSDLGWGGLLCLLAFVAYRIVVEICLRLWPVPDADGQSRRLLLLRVFGFQRRTEKLFDGIAARWRFSGSAKMIAGADLVSRLIDPGDFISFVGGRLNQQFVENDADLVRRLGRIDELPDPDGRFRVNEFFCHDNTWRPTLQALLERSDVVLMDLRGFSRQNSGCQFELQQLVEHSLLQRTVFVVDETTDSKLLESSLIETGGSVATPGNERAGINLVHAKKHSAAEIRTIYRALQTCG